MSNSRSFNVKLLAISFLVIGIPLCLLGAFMGLVILAGSAGDSIGTAIIMYVLFFPLSIVLIVCSIGLFRRKAWALPLLLISGIGLLILFPIGTVIGIMALVAYADLRALKMKRS